MDTDSNLGRCSSGTQSATALATMRCAILTILRRAYGQNGLVPVAKILGGHYGK